jgi:hypothetical protein
MSERSYRGSPTRRLVMSDTLEDLRHEVERGRDIGMSHGFSARLTEIADRYDAIVRAYSPRGRFSDAEWQIVKDALSHNWPKPTIDLGERVYGIVANALFIDGQVNNDLLVKVKDLDLVTSIALMEMTYRDLVHKSEAESETHWRIEIELSGRWKTVRSLDIPPLGFATKEEAESYIASNMADVAVPLRVVGAET